MRSSTQQEINNALFYRAYTGDVTALSDPDVSKIRDVRDNTPLHWAARNFDEASRHPDFDKVKNDKGETPKAWYDRSLK